MARSVADCILALLASRGSSGATLSEIYVAVRKELGGGVLDAAIRGAVYKRLPTAKGKYKARVERFIVDGEARYRPLS